MWAEGLPDAGQIQAAEFDVELRFAEMPYHVIERATLGNPALEQRVIPARPQEVAADERPPIGHQPDAGLAPRDRTVKLFSVRGSLHHHADRGVLDLKELGAVAKDRRAVLDGVAQHGAGREFTLPPRTIPDLLHQGNFARKLDLGAVSGSPHARERSGEIRAYQNPPATGRRRRDSDQPLDGRVHTDGHTQHLAGVLTAGVRANAAHPTAGLREHLRDLLLP